ncbi:UNVERIFIED_CONTAM: Retrovirus-related Pol polyprotein from transposon TNT 1-94 [Sesamum radiatum]|uniref:Retrovirus-related Pol polyprotein from transposon TNT 1-94 n=1 Tax=Sesamum radiatum TaxID=300843 RepID=A0AAW2NBK2_SESRA
MRYKMVDDRSVAEQTHEIINLEHALADAEMKLLEKFLVMSIVDKFPKSWENFGMTLKHQKRRLSLDDLMIAISIEEEHRNQTHKMPVGHWAKLCPNKKAKTRQAVVNMVVGGSSGASTSGAMEGYVSVQPELLTIYEPCDWLIDTGANVHVCADKSLFVSYQAITGKTVSMGNSSTAEVLGIGSVDLKFPSGCILSLKRVHHVPTVRRNIISGSVIVREGYELAFKFNKVVIQQFGIFVETPPYSPSSNGVAERKNKTFKDMINNLLLTSDYQSIWGRGFEYGLPYSEQSPSETQYEYSFRIVERFLVIKSEIPGIEVNTIVEFRDAVFLEDVFPMKTGIPSSVSLDDSLASTSIPEHVEKMTNVGVNSNSAGLTHEESDIPRRRSCIEIITETKSFLKNKFEMKDMGEADVILGIKLIRPTDGITISQSHYVEKIIEKFGYQNSRIAKTPYDSSVALFKNESGVSVAQLRFPVVLEGYSDASWIAKNSGSNGCSGYVFTLGGGAVSWKSAKQTLITRSTFEAELLRWIRLVPRQNGYLGCYRNFPLVIGIDFVGTKDNVADPLTKGLDLSQAQIQGIVPFDLVIADVR